MQQLNNSFEIGLNIHLLSFTLPKNLIKNKEEVRVSITTMPDGRKQHFYLKGKKMYCSNHVFSINITNQTKNIIMVFRKKVFLSENPIIASKTIHLREYDCFPKQPIETGMISSEVRSVNIYYPLQKQKEEEVGNENFVCKENEKSFKRKILGQMELQLTFTPPYEVDKKEKKKEEKKEKKEKKEEKNTGSIHKINKKSKNNNNEYTKIENEIFWGN